MLSSLIVAETICGGSPECLGALSRLPERYFPARAPDLARAGLFSLHLSVCVPPSFTHLSLTLLFSSYMINNLVEKVITLILPFTINDKCKYIISEIHSAIKGNITDINDYSDLDWVMETTFV